MSSMSMSSSFRAGVGPSAAGRKRRFRWNTVLHPWRLDAAGPIAKRGVSTIKKKMDGEWGVFQNHHSHEMEEEELDGPSFDKNPTNK